MHITPISCGLAQYQPLQLKKKTNQNTAQTGMGISFGQAMKTPIANFVVKAAEKDMGRMQRIATTFLDVIESVAMKLKNKGVSFNREYNEGHAVKSPAKYPSKIIRSGSMEIRDRVRATLFCKNIYDLSILNDDILPEFKKRGYVLADIGEKCENLLKRGFIPEESTSLNAIIKVPDIDIRLNKSDLQIDKLDPQLHFAISKPQSSGYEDIQMRLVRDYDKRRYPVTLELIILMGENYANAKHIDSDMIYNFTRKFKELNIVKNHYPDEEVSKAKRYVELIKAMFETEATRKLYDNAKNKDMYGIEEEIPIKFSPSSIKLFENYFIDLNRAIASFYRGKIDSCKKNELKIKKLKAEQRADKALIQDVQTNLRKTIEFLNKQKTAKKSN